MDVLGKPRDPTQSGFHSVLQNPSHLPDMTRDVSDKTRDVWNITREPPDMTRDVQNITRELPDITRDVSRETRGLWNITRLV